MKIPKKKTRRAQRVTATFPVIEVLDKYTLRLFVAGATARSHQAVLRVRELCDTILKGRVKLEVIDIYQQPGLARENQIVATPTLIVQLPLPVRRFIGNLTTIADLFSLMDLDEKGRIVL
jgi:circadian clock protein KaiB